MIRHVHEDEAPSSPLPKENVPNPPAQNESTSESSSSLHRLLTTKALSVSWVQKSASSYRLNFMTRSSIFEDEIKAAKQALGIVLYPHIWTTYYQADKTSFLNDHNNASKKHDLLKTVVRPLWLACYKEVSALEQKCAAAQDELKIVQDKLGLLQVLLASPCQKEQSKMPAHKVQQWKLTWRQTQLQGLVQDLQKKITQHKDDFGVDLYNKLQAMPQLHVNDDSFLVDAIAKCRETIQRIVLTHQQKTLDAGSKVLNLQDTTSDRKDVVVVPAKVVTTTTDPKSNKPDEEESVTEETETDDSEYEEVET